VLEGSTSKKARQENWIWGEYRPDSMFIIMFSVVMVSVRVSV
jgi:hypothetical protein